MKCRKHLINEATQKELGKFNLALEKMGVFWRKKNKKMESWLLVTCQ